MENSLRYLGLLLLLIGVFDYTSSLNFSKDVEGYKHLGSYRSHSKNGKDFSDADYWVSAGAASWSVARTDCQRRFPGSDLIWFETEEELKYIADMIANRFPGTLGHWTSGEYDVPRKIWIWAGNREPVPDFITWLNGPPTAVDSNSRLTVLIFEDTYYPFDVDTAGFAQPYICKLAAKEPEPEVPIIPCYKTLDLELVLDSSGSIGAENYQLALSYLSNLTTAFTVHNESRIGFLTYSNTATRYIPLTNFMTPEQIVQTIQATPYDAGNTYTNLGVDMAVDSLILNERLIPRAMVVLTDGASSDPAATQVSAVRAKNEGIAMYAVGITNATTDAELLLLAGGLTENVFHAYDWGDLIPLLTTTSELICPRQ